ncbi:MAG: polyphosphate polymerase domain-containing protein [Bacteroidia bacterium]
MIPEAVHQSLDLFEPITLEEMDRVKLMDRTDMKFNFHVSRLPEILKAVKDDYRVLEVSGKRMSRYETLYFDTPSYELFRVHHAGKASRYKIRLRKYVESDLSFFEVKYKNNKGRTIKSRIKRKIDNNHISDEAEKFLEEKTGMHGENLEAKLWINYTRITLVNKHDEERLTIDLDLHVKNEQGFHAFEGLVIVEAKQSKVTETPFVRQLKNQRIRQFGMSKYCMAVSKLVADIKKNNFKPGLTTIEKIINDPNAA